MIEFLAKGKRGIVYIDKEKKTAVKQPNPQSRANNRLEIEAMFLKKLNRHGIGPKFISYHDNKLEMAYVEGERIADYFKNPLISNPQVKKVIKEVFFQLFTMDSLGINKQEMTNPYKHIIVSKNRPIMIDFEKCRYSKKHKNVSQFIQFICTLSIQNIFREKNIVLDCKNLRKAVLDYKKSLTRKDFEKILSFFG